MYNFVTFNFDWVADILLNNDQTHANDVDVVDGPNGNSFCFTQYFNKL